VFFTIYKITNNINNKIYIGKHQTAIIDDGYMGSGKILKAAIKKYGVENFKKDILHIFNSEEDMNAMEKELVTEDFCLRPDTYNLCIGGKGGFGYINTAGKNLYGLNGKTPNVTDNLIRGRATQRHKKETDAMWVEHKATRISVKKKEYIKNYGNPFKGKTHSVETKRIIGEKSSLHQTGHGNSQYGKRWIYSTTEQRSIKILKTNPLPDGWSEGRKLKF
jgi:hypothetical protein